MYFVETKHFTRLITNLLSDEDYGELQNDLLHEPELGDKMPGSGGIRKLRFAAKGRGKRGGARVIYYWAVSKELILMLDAYPKNEKADLSKDELRKLRRVVDAELG